MADSSGALLALLGVLVGGYFNNFLAEDFRRFRDSQALAAALAGELESRAQDVPGITRSLQLLTAAEGTMFKVKIPEWTAPQSPIFEANAGTIGLLSPGDAMGVAYVYERIRSYRDTLLQLSKHHADMGNDWGAALAKECITTMDKAGEIGAPLIERLKRHTATSYWRRPQTWRQCITVALFVAAFMFGASLHHTGSADSKTDCTAADDHGLLHMVCR